MFRLVLITLGLYFFNEVAGHGMMLEPVGRASRWRYNLSAPINYNDNELFCGGFSVQWEVNEGKCGLCGDNYRDATPRRHELGGEFGEGVIVRSYAVKGTIPVGIMITANHRGYFYYQICNVDENKETEECYQKHPINLVTGEDRYEVTRYDSEIWFNTTLQIPEGLKCSHCVLRWTYRAGNNWGQCENGSYAVGCGDQEHFRSCADIQIL